LRFRTRTALPALLGAAALWATGCAGWGPRAAPTGPPPVLGAAPAGQPATAPAGISVGPTTAADNRVPVQPPAVSAKAPGANAPAPGADGLYRYPMAVSGQPVPRPGGVQPVQYGAPAGSPVDVGQFGRLPPIDTPPNALPPSSGPPVFGAPPGPDAGVGLQPLPGQSADLLVNVQETQTGRLMVGVGVNSDAGLTGQIVIDERNFDWRRFPTSIDDITNGTAFRGGGQGLRIEAIPGSEVQRYLVNFVEPYLLDTQISLSLSGFLYDRRYTDWTEQRLGGRIGLGYRLTHDLSLTTALRLESVKVFDPRVPGVPELEEVLGQSDFYSGRVTLTHDTRDMPFAPTEGHLLELSYEQAFGTFDYPRGELDYRRYHLINERPDGSGRHVLGNSFRLGVSGAQTPLYENFFAGGYSTLRGFDFRGASPVDMGVRVGGEFSLLGSLEYLFPITADDMLKGVVFVDYGTVEREIEIHAEDFRVAVGAGLRISVPAMGPAPIALDFAVPVARADTDDIENFSFFVGFGR